MTQTEKLNARHLAAQLYLSRIAARNAYIERVARRVAVVIVAATVLYALARLTFYP